MSKTIFEIVNKGMGSLLNPPGDVEHKFSVEKRTPYRRRDGSYAVRTALQEKEVPEFIKEQLVKLMDEHKGELTVEWEHSCYNYFRSCYSPDGVNRNASECVIDRENNQPPTNHLAYLHIKSWFPEYEPNEELIHNNGDNGSWSAKPNGE